MTYRLIYAVKRHFFWPNLKAEIAMFILTIPINISYFLLLTGYYIGLREDLWIFIVRDVIMAYFICPSS